MPIYHAQYHARAQRHTVLPHEQSDELCDSRVARSKLVHRLAHKNSASYSPTEDQLTINLCLILLRPTQCATRRLHRHTMASCYSCWCGSRSTSRSRSTVLWCAHHNTCAQPRRTLTLPRAPRGRGLTHWGNARLDAAEALRPRRGLAPVRLASWALAAPARTTSAIDLWASIRHD